MSISKRLDPDLVKKNMDESIIGVSVILGSSYTGYYGPAEEISQDLDNYEKETIVDMPDSCRQFVHRTLHACQSR